MTATPAVTFGDLLRRYRLTAGLTQEELAEKAQVSPRAISDLERGDPRHVELEPAPVRSPERFAA